MSDKIISLSEKRQPVCYTLRITHHWDGTVEGFVEDVQDDERSRQAVRDAFVRLASAWFTPKDVNTLLLTMIDARMDATEGERLRELDVLVDACQAIERKI